MMYDQGHQPMQHLVCFQHNEPIKGVCLWTGKCNERFMCRTCRRFHDSAHLNSYEEWDDLRNQNLIMDLKNEFDGISEKIEKQNVTYDENIRFIRSQIEYLFKEIQTHILHKLTQTRDTLISNINKKVDKNNVTQHKLRNSLIDVNRTYEKAFNTNFSNLNLAEDMVRAICNAQNLRDTTNNDPELQSKETISFSVNHLANANLFQHIKMSLDQVCQDVANSFVVDNTGKLPSVPKGSLLQSGMFPAQEDQNLISSLDMRSTEPFGARDMNYDRGYQGGGGYGGYRQNENVMPRLSPFNKVITQGDTLGQEKSTPNRLLKIFENANQEEGGDRTRMRGEMLEYRDRIVTSHKTIMYGGLLYIPLKRHLVTAGMEGAIEILKTGNGNMESLHTFKAHNGEVLRIQYIPEKNVLLSSGMDNKICVWDYHQKCKLLHTFTRHAGPVYAMEYLPDQDLVISGGEDEVIRMWNVNTCREHHTLKTANAKISSICRLEKQKRIAVGFDKGNVSIFATGQLKKNLFNIRAHNTYVFNVAAIPEQNLLLTSADDGLKVWRLLETKADFMRKFTQEGSMLRSFLVFQDKDLLLTNTDQNQIKIWKLSTGQKLGQYNDKTFGESMVCLPDQDEIATANLNEVKRWVVTNY